MTTRNRMTLDDGMMVWKARDAYRVHTVLLALFYLPQLLFALCGIAYLSRGLWAPAVSMALAILALWVVRWVLCTGLPRLVRLGWRAVRGRGVAVLLLALVLGGCAEYGYRMNELAGFNCRPEALQNGQCVATKRGSQ